QQIGHTGTSDPVFALHDAMNALKQSVRRGFLQYDSARAQLQRFNDLITFDGCGKDNDSNGILCKGAHRVHACPVRHGKIEQQDVWPEFFSEIDGDLAVHSLTDDLQAGLGLQEHFETITKNGVVVSDEYANRLQTSCHSLSQKN